MRDLVVSCVLGLLVGGVLGGFGIAIIQNVRSGRIKVPTTAMLGPLKIDTFALARADGVAATPVDISSMAPMLEIGGSATSGCLSLFSASMVLGGFLLSWFTCNIAFLISGNYSGFNALVQLVTGVLLVLVATSAGVAGGGLERGALGGLLTILLMVVLGFLALTPILGLNIGRTGLRLIQSPRTSNLPRRQTSRLLVRAAVIDLLPLLCYLASPTDNVNFPGLSELGAPLQAGVGG